MALKNQKEWFIELPWGKVAMVSFGDPKNPPVLLVHGYLDSAATFLAILEHLPDNYYYVGFDIPGHGKSEPFPAGNLPSQVHVVEVMRKIVESMKWDQFIFLGHSMSYVIGIFYNAVFPNRISKMINLDPLPPVANYNTHLSMYETWFYFHYEQYYSYYKRWTNRINPLHYTLEEAVGTIASSRNVSDEQAKVMLSRTLIPDGNGKYTFSWDPKMKRITDITCPREMTYSLMSTNIPPTLNLVSTINNGLEHNKKFGELLMKEVEDSVPHFYVVYIEGRHDVHCSNPERLVPHVVEFLNKDFNVNKSKL